MPNTTAPKNPHRIPVREWIEDQGFDSIEDAIESGAFNDSVVAALCDEYCEVEPDGRCPHGCPSPLLALGLI
jgi:hypothetical protein